MLEHLIPAKPATSTEWLMTPYMTEPPDGTEHNDVLGAAVLQLTDLERECVQTIFFERRTYQELSELIGFSKPHAWRLTQKALLVLQRALEANPLLNERYRMYKDWNTAASAIIDRFDDCFPLPADMEIVQYTSRCMAVAVRNLETPQHMLYGRMAVEAVGQLKNMYEWDVQKFLELLCSKQADYGHENITNFGLIGVSVRLCDKVARLVNVLGRGGDTAVTGETLVDTWLDIVGYCVIATMLINDSFKLELAA